MLVAASRVLLGVHWLTDVIGGAALGFGWFVVCSVAFGGALLHFGAPAERVEAEEARLSGVQEPRPRGAPPMPDSDPSPESAPGSERVDSRAGSLAAEPGNASQDPDAQAKALLEESAARVVAPAARDAARRLLARGMIPGTKVVGKRRRDRGGYATPFAMQGMAIGRGFSGAVHITEVEVDTRMGTIRPLRVWAGIAAGHIYAERPARNQCEGGIIQGIGYALYEQRHVDPVTGTVLTANLEDYRIPGIGDTPEMTIHFHQDGWDHVNGRGVGLGEVSTVGVAASVANAVHHATGWRPHDLPIRPDRLLEGISA